MKKFLISLVAIVATLSLSAQMRVYVDQNNKSAYVLTDLKNAEVTFLANGKSVMTMFEESRLAPYIPLRVFEDIVWSAEDYNAYAKRMYSYSYGDKIYKNNFWEISVIVKWEENGIKKDSTFIACCPSNIAYITHNDIETANRRNEMEAKAEDLRTKLYYWGIDLKWHGYHGEYFKLTRRDSTTGKDLSFYVSNDFDIASNDSVITIKGLPYRNSCKENQLEDAYMGLVIDDQHPKGPSPGVKENYFTIKIRKKGTSTLETFLANKKKEGTYYF
jgi:hypothetical protein